MTAKEKLSEVLSGNYNLEFETAEIIKSSMTVAKIDETIYIRQGSPFGGIMTVLNYSDTLEKIQKYGIMKNFTFGNYDFFSHWEIISKDPLTLLQIENDSITSIKLTAIDLTDMKDIIMDIIIEDCIIRCKRCRYIF